MRDRHRRKSSISTKPTQKQRARSAAVQESLLWVEGTYLLFPHMRDGADFKSENHRTTATMTRMITMETLREAKSQMMTSGAGRGSDSKASPFRVKSRLSLQRGFVLGNKTISMPGGSLRLGSPIRSLDVLFRRQVFDLEVLHTRYTDHQTRSDAVGSRPSTLALPSRSAVLATELKPLPDEFGAIQKDWWMARGNRGQGIYWRTAYLLALSVQICSGLWRMEWSGLGRLIEMLSSVWSIP